MSEERRYATVHYRCPQCDEVTVLGDFSESQVKGDLGDIGFDIGRRRCWNPECGGVDLVVTEIEWEEDR
jgi:hypothetical protein